MGRPAFEFTKERLEMVERMAGVGLNHERMAAVLGISLSTMDKKASQIKEVNEAIQRGKGKASFTVGKALFEKAREGDVPAIKWFETTRDGRSDRQQLLGDENQPLNIAVNKVVYADDSDTE